MLTITSVYAALLGLMFIGLSVRTLMQRRQAKVALGNGDDKELLRRIRVHGNFAEYTPIGLLLAAFAELQGVHWIVVHLVCSLLLVGRVCHAFGVSRTPEVFSYRVAGMSMTFASISIGALAILVAAV